MDTIKQGHGRRAPGMLYGLEFPWNEELLGEFGAKWLTTAFHTAGTLPKDNWITKIIFQNEIKVTAGNNAGKFLFEVRYAKQSAHLHTKLFAKVPFPLSGATHSDRLSSSFYKQTMDFLEIETYRLLEAALPFPTPRFYFGDISNETTNYILITEQVPFKEMHGIQKDVRLQPFEVEGPYDKCKDFNLRGSARDYYMVLLQKQARIAGVYKAGLVPRIYDEPPQEPEAYGLDPSRATGENPGSCVAGLGRQFMAETARAVFPDYVAEAPFQRKFRDTMMLLNAYSAEINWWKNANTDYASLGHQNLNVDNAYFWRDESGGLDCGVFDFGGFSCSSLPHKLWWMLNMAEFKQVKANMDDYIDAFIRMYHEHGGPLLERDTVKTGIIITALQNCMIMVSALPNALKQCPAKEWLTIKDRHDPRIAGNIDGKSTLRSNIHVLNITARLLEEMEGDSVLTRWITDTWVGQLGQQRKSGEMIGNAEGGAETTRW
eukprot:CAMPEP_0168504022 /NCGR_PEP_ID=MMETSP0228-20121227/76156_1 /TAXON_ID=133427 /ORGANISM="Protoceratium reticulatum, Strain CCCM 535 (=CCMP 1889)" /LENGTH=488 /DNA_ID=CAMNT_0008521095 /DNA_START=48 /DNA_END=1515 /DNA_ORIENTATION=-